MQFTNGLAAAALVGFTIIGAHVAAQGPQLAPPPAGAAADATSQEAPLGTRRPGPGPGPQMAEPPHPRLASSRRPVLIERGNGAVHDRLHRLSRRGPAGRHRGRTDLLSSAVVSNGQSGNSFDRSSAALAQAKGCRRCP